MFNNVLTSKEAAVLHSKGVKLISTDRQIQNGTICLGGEINKVPYHYEITASGAVISNKNVVRQVFGGTQYHQYRAGLKAVNELIEKRFASRFKKG